MKFEFLLVLIALLALAAPLRADDPPPDAAPPPGTASDEQHEDVVVSATRSERSAADVPVSATVIPKREIEESPVHTTDDLLRVVPGLLLPSTPSSVLYPTSDTISMRGLGGNRVLVLLDGFPLNDPFSGYIPWSRVPVQSIQRVEVVRGGAASLYGNYAMGGVVNLLAVPADEEHLSAETAYGSYNTRKVDASYNHLLSASTGIGVDVSTFDTDGYFRTPASDRGAIDTPFSSRSRVFGLRFDHASEAGLTTFARASYSRNVLSNGTMLSGDDRNALDFSGGIEKADALGGDLAVRAFGERQEFDNQNTSLVNGDRDAEVLSNSHQTPIRSLGGSIQWTRHFSTTLPLITVGLDVQRIQGEDRGENFDAAGSLTRRRNSGGRQDFGGLFAEADLFPSPRFEVLASVRLDGWRSFDGKETTHPGSDIDYPAKNTTQVDPRLALRYSLAPGFALRGAIYRAFRAPTLSDLYRASQSKGFQVLGNPDLGPETMVGGEIGAEFAGGSWSGQLNLFSNVVRDLISRVPIATTPQLVFRTVNVGQTWSRGVEIFGKYAVGGGWSVNAAVTYTRSTITDNPPDRSIEGNLVPQVPERFASLGVEYSFSGSWTASVRARTQSRRYEDTTNQIRLDPFTVVDLYLERSLGRDLQVKGWIENLFNRQYVSDALLGPRFGAPRQFFVGIGYRPAPAGAPAG